MNLQLDSDILDKLQYKQFNEEKFLSCCLTIHRDNNDEIDYYLVNILDFYGVINQSEIIYLDYFRCLKIKLRMHDSDTFTGIPLTDETIGGKLHSRKYNIKVQGELDDDGYIIFPEIDNDNPFFISMLDNHDLTLAIKIDHELQIHSSNWLRCKIIIEGGQFDSTTKSELGNSEHYQLFDPKNMHPKLLEPEIQEKMIHYHTYKVYENLYCIYDIDYQIYDDNHNLLKKEDICVGMRTSGNNNFNSNNLKTFDEKNPLVSDNNILILADRHYIVHFTYTRRLRELMEN